MQTSSRNNGRTTTRCARHSRKGAEAVRCVKEDAGEKVRRNEGEEAGGEVGRYFRPKAGTEENIRTQQREGCLFRQTFRSSKNRPDDVATVENSGNGAPIRAGDLAESDSNEGEDKNSFITISHPVVDREGGGRVTITAELDYDEGEATKLKVSNADAYPGCNVDGVMQRLTNGKARYCRS